MFLEYNLRCYVNFNASFEAGLENKMSELLVVFVAIALALLMAIKPEMFVLNEKRRTPRFIKAIKNIGISVCIVLLAMLAATYLF